MLQRKRDNMKFNRTVQCMKQVGLLVTRLMMVAVMVSFLSPAVAQAQPLDPHPNRG